MNLNDINEVKPPKTEPFLAATSCGFEMMEWKETIVNGKSRGFYGFYCPCACCGGNCSESFQFWMPMPRLAFKKEYNLWNKIIEEMPKAEFKIIPFDDRDLDSALTMERLLNSYMREREEFYARNAIPKSEEQPEGDSLKQSSEAKS